MYLTMGSQLNTVSLNIPQFRVLTHIVPSVVVDLVTVSGGIDNV
jgi:hypothetical protein